MCSYTVCPTGYRTRHFFNNSNTNKDIAMKFEHGYVRCVGNEEECVCSASNCCYAEQRSASQPVSVASGTLCIIWCISDQASICSKTFCVQRRKPGEGNAEVRASQRRRYVYMHLLRQLLNGGVFGSAGSVARCVAWSGVLVEWRDEYILDVGVPRRCALVQCYLGESTVDKNLKCVCVCVCAGSVDRWENEELSETG
jgi:hypothetical protein